MPAFIPLITPVAGSIVAIEGLRLVHTPIVSFIKGLEKCVAHTSLFPLIIFIIGNG